MTNIIQIKLIMKALIFIIIIAVTTSCHVNEKIASQYIANNRVDICELYCPLGIDTFYKEKIVKVPFFYQVPGDTVKIEIDCESENIVDTENQNVSFKPKPGGGQVISICKEKLYQDSVNTLRIELKETYDKTTYYTAELRENNKIISELKAKNKNLKKRLTCIYLSGSIVLLIVGLIVYFRAKIKNLILRENNKIISEREL